MGERLEILMRIVVGIVTGIILGIWKIAVYAVWIIHILYTFITGKRHAGMAQFANRWLSQVYRFFRYISLTTNQRPFPFNDLGKDVKKINMKK